MIARILASVLATSVCVAGATANPVGKWRGAVNVTPNLPPRMTAEQRKVVERSIAVIRSMRIELTVKADKTYVVKTTYGIAPAGGSKTPPPESGMWSSSGDRVRFRSSRNKQGQLLVLSSDKKTMTATVPSGQGQPPAKIVFTRA